MISTKLTSLYRLRGLSRILSQVNHQKSLSSMAASRVAMVCDNIEKSEEDSRKYRGLELSNGIKVMLISDPSADKASAAMDIHVGNMSDPDSIPGIAHFCEHMLFLGTEKYPSENEYSQFLSQHGGFSNAYTSGEHTNYYFDVSHEHLTGALDRFSQFFLCPLFNESSKDREVNAVDSENNKNLKNDRWRIHQLDKHLAKIGHPYRKFGTGNKQTLETVPLEKGLNVRNELLEFHATYYSSNIMGLSVLGRETLDELTEMVVDMFSKVENKNIKIPEWTDPPYGEEHLKIKCYAVPIMDVRSLNLTFPIPDLEAYYRSKPGHYLGHLIGHEGPGSLLSELKARGWVNSLMGGEKDGARGYMFFIINVDLTTEGLEHVDDIITHMFQYLNMLRKEGAKQWIHQECSDLSRVTFRFKDKEKPSTLTSHLSGMLHDYSLPEVLSAPYLMTEYQPDIIELVLSRLIPDNVRVVVVAKAFEGETNEFEDWYGTEYKVEHVSPNTLEKWKNAGLNPKFRLPDPNEFIATNFDLVTQEIDPSPVPVLIQDTAMSRIWFKQDDTFKLPKAVLNFELISPTVYQDPLHCNLAYMFMTLFTDSLVEYSYSAELAGVEYSLNHTVYGLYLKISGYNDKQTVLLRKIIEKLTSFEINEQRFGIIKEGYSRGLANFKAQQPYHHALYYTTIIMSEVAWTKQDLIDCLDEVTVDRLKIFVTEVLRNLSIEALILGNVTRKKALEISELVERILREKGGSKPLFPSLKRRHRELQLPDGCYYKYEKENEVHNNCSVEIYYQTGIQDTSSNVTLELFSQIIQEPCFNILRTKEQLGYIVVSGIRRSSGVQGLRFIVQSEMDPVYLESRVEAFLKSMESYMEEMPDEEFQRHMAALVVKRLDKPKKLSAESAKQWSEIISRHYNFERDSVEVALLKKLAKKNVLSFYRECLDIESPSRHKLSVHIVSKEVASLDAAAEQIDLTGVNKTSSFDLNPCPTLGEPEVITDVASFKTSLPLFPLPQPYSNEAKAKL